MTTTRATATPPAPSDAAATLRDAPLVRLLVRRDGDAVAAAGVLARALRAIDVPVQVSPTASRDERGRRADAGDPDAATVAIGPVDAADLSLGGDDRPAALAAAEIAGELDGPLAAELALAGVHAAGAVPGAAAPELLEAARDRGLERRPGVGLATGDPVDGLAHATLFHASFSGSPAEAADALADAGIDPEADPAADHRRALASLVAVAATEGPAPDRAARTVERALRPHAIGGPAPTVEGYGDLLDVVAAAEPGLAIAHAAGDASLASLEPAWREASGRAHAALAGADPARYDGFVAYDADGASPSLVARLARDARCPEPVAVAIGADAVGVATREPGAAGPAAAVAEALDGALDASARRAVVRDLEAAERETAIDAVRDATGADRP